MRIPGKDITYQPDPRECELKVSLFSVKKRNVLGRFLGCFNPKKDELYEAVNEDSYSKIMVIVNHFTLIWNFLDLFDLYILLLLLLLLLLFINYLLIIY